MSSVDLSNYIESIVYDLGFQSTSYPSSLKINHYFKFNELFVMACKQCKLALVSAALNGRP